MHASCPATAHPTSQGAGCTRSSQERGWEQVCSPGRTLRCSPHVSARGSQQVRELWSATPSGVQQATPFSSCVIYTQPLPCEGSVVRKLPAKVLCDRAGCDENVSPAISCQWDFFFSVVLTLLVIKQKCVNVSACGYPFMQSKVPGKPCSLSWASPCPAFFSCFMILFLVHTGSCSECSHSSAYTL